MKDEQSLSTVKPGYSECIDRLSFQEEEKHVFCNDNTNKKIQEQNVAVFTVPVLNNLCNKSKSLIN